MSDKRFDLDNRYDYHPPKRGEPGVDQPSRYECIRAHCKDLAQIIVANTPVSAEQTRALNALDEVMFLANAAIARNE